MLPSQEAQLKGKKAHQVDVNSAKLKQHTAILELLIQNSDGMGFLSEEIEERYQTCLSMPSYQSQSEGELLDEETSCGATRRKVTKKKHIRRRSGSLSRVLSVMGKAMGLGRTPGTTKGESLFAGWCRSDRIAPLAIQRPLCCPHTRRAHQDFVRRVMMIV